MQDVHTIAAAVRAANAKNVSRGCRIRSRKMLARVMMIATGVAGVVCMGLTETNIAFGVAAIPLLAVTLVLQGKNRTLGRQPEKAKKKNILQPIIGRKWEESQDD